MLFIKFEMLEKILEVFNNDATISFCILLPSFLLVMLLSHCAILGILPEIAFCYKKISNTFLVSFL